MKLLQSFQVTRSTPGWMSAVILCYVLAGSALANNPGGAITNFATSVTTGTEAFGNQTDRFLDNGILHVSVGATGSVNSIKYLQPGLSGNPKANGIEMVSQIGFTGTTGGFGNHYNIYYYWYPDSNGAAAYLSTTGTATSSLDLAYKRAYSSTRDAVPVDMEIHYVLGKGNTVLYVYMVANHPSSYSSYGDMSISFMQMIWPVAHDSTNFTCENLYIDSIKTGLTLNGTQLMRQAIEPNYPDSNLAVTVSGFPKEIMQMTTGAFSGQLTGKYSYTTDYWKLGAWGRASDVNNIGQWVVQGSHEYLNNGPTVCEYVDGWGLLYYEPCVAHYDNTGITVSGTANWTKVFGPWALYFNSVATGTASWQDAKNQALAEQGAWPYSWLTNSNYQPKAQRANVTGKLVINDALRPGSSAAGAWVGLAAPDSGVENAPDNWQFQSDQYQYWVQAAADGTFAIPNVQTISPYGGAATYKLYAYSSGTNASTGSVGEYSLASVPIASGSTTNLGTLTWNVPHQGQQLVWEIGIPDRTAAEFRHGDEYGKPGLWTQFINEFANPLEYNVADNNWATALNYCHSVDNMATSPWKWHINFNLPSVIQGTYYLNIAYASPSSVQVIRVNDDSSIFATFTPDNADPGASTYLRQGIHSKYSVAHIPIPSSQLLPGANTITLDHEVHSTHATAHFMYDYIDLEAPAPVVLPPGRDLIWKGGVSSNAWNNVAANWLVSGSNATTVSFVDGDRPLFNDTGSTSPSIQLSGTATPGQVTFSNSTKNYTLTGSGTLAGPMQFIKSGTGTLTISPTVVSLTGCVTTINTTTVSVSSTANLFVGMGVAGTGIPASTTIAAFLSSTSLTLSQKATSSATSTLTFSTLHTYNGGSTLNAGTVIFANSAANSNGLGVGPVTFNGGTLQMFDNTATYGSAYWSIDVPIGSTGTLKADSRIDLYGNLTGGGVFNFYVPYIRTTLYGNWSHFSGKLNITTDADGGDVRINNTNGFPGAAINLGPRVTAYVRTSASGIYPVGELSGDPASVLEGIILDSGATGAFTTTWSVGGRNTDANFAGKITNGLSPSVTAITKVGSGTWTLSGACAYTGPTTILGGTLRVTGTGTGSTGLTVGDGATLELGDGTLSINGPIVNSANGTVRLTGLGKLLTTGTFTNYGVVDVMTNKGGLPANFVNQGMVVDSSAVQVQHFLVSSTGAQLSIQSYAGHNYQLQRSTALVSGSWSNIGAAQTGNDDVLTLSDPTVPTGAGFYRIIVAP